MKKVETVEEGQVVQQVKGAAVRAAAVGQAMMPPSSHDPHESRILGKGRRWPFRLGADMACLLPPQAEGAGLEECLCFWHTVRAAMRSHVVVREGLPHTVQRRFVPAPGGGGRSPSS